MPMGRVGNIAAIGNSECVSTLPCKSRDYILPGDIGSYDWDDRVNWRENNMFITVLNQPTPAAQPYANRDPDNGHRCSATPSHALGERDARVRVM